MGLIKGEGGRGDADETIEVYADRVCRLAFVQNRSKSGAEDGKPLLPISGMMLYPQCNR